MGRALLGVVLTDACNLRCEYCCVPEKGRRRIAWPALQAALDGWLRSTADTLEVTFTGGEPLLAFATLRRAVTYVERKAARRRVIWRVTTNGLLLDNERLAFLDARRFLVNLSFDGVPAAQSLRGRATHARLDHLLDHLREHHAELFHDRLKVCLTLTPASLSHLADSVAYFLEKGVGAFAVSPAIGGVDWPLRRIDELDRQFERVSGTLLHVYRATGNVPFVLFRKSLSESEAPVPGPACDVLKGNVLVVDADGSTCGCLAATRTYQPHPGGALRPAVEALRFGPAGAPDAEARRAAVPVFARDAGIFEHPERRYSSYRRCQDCAFLRRCHVCPLAQAGVAGWDDEYRVSDFLCAFNQVALAHRDRFPCQPTAWDFFSGKVPLSALPRLGG